MDATVKIHAKLRKILKKLKGIGIVETFKLEINFCQIDENLKRTLIEIDAVLKKCLRKIISKPRTAEIRNVISELVRKKNLSKNEVEQFVEDNILAGGFPSEQCTNKSELKVECSFCEEKFISKESLVSHRKTHKIVKYLCEKCGNLFYNIQNWQKHEKQCNEQHLYSYEVQNFVVNLKNDSNILNGLLEPKMKSETFCQSMLKQPEGEELNNEGYKINLESEIPIETRKSFFCGCGKVFQVLKTFQKHQRLKHSLLNINHDCIICGKSFIEKGKLNRHMLSHTERQYHCSFCFKEFSRSDTLKRHMSLFHFTPKEYFCNICQKKFKLKYNRDIHVKSIHKNVNWIPCSHCTEKFRNKVKLNRHLKIHFEQMNCDNLSQKFIQKANLLS